MPRRVIRNRLPGVVAPLAPVVHLVGKGVFAACDALHLGLMVNIYGRKIGPPRS